MWHEAAQRLAKDHDFVLLGITQEQHPERCRLFAQWHQIEWPILHDPIDLMGATAVPLFVAIDEHGVVRHTRISTARFEEEFLNVEYSPPDDPRADDAQPDDARHMSINLGPDSLPSMEQQATRAASRDAWRELGDARLLWQTADEIPLAISNYQQALRTQPDELQDDERARIEFRLGVAYRMRYESSLSQPSDFQTAVDYWQAALARDPNQYIWRRRIQQYGPRLDKPYPFYDWLEQARTEIRERGEEPIGLKVEPRGAELASPSRDLIASSEVIELRDEEGRIQRDEFELIGVRAIAVQGTGQSSGAYQLHVIFEPNEAAHWNNEVEPMVVWLEEIDGIQFGQRAAKWPSPAEAETVESRMFEFEVHKQASAELPLTIKGYALFYVCEELNGQCLFLRKDFAVELK